MTGLVFRSEVMEQILLRESRFAEGAYIFVISALEYQQSLLEYRRHITAREMSFACRDLALRQFGVMARVVLNKWGLYTTEDLGAVVFTLVELGYLSCLPTDNRSQFKDLYDFVEVFDRDYPWNGMVAA